MRTPRRAVESLAKKLRATIGTEGPQTCTGDVYTITVDAPRGQHWIDGRVHFLRIEGRPTRDIHKDEMWIDALERMRTGLTECDFQRSGVRRQRLRVGVDPKMAKNPHAVALGKIGDSVTSDRKASASRENGKKGGRPKGSKNKKHRLRETHAPSKTRKKSKEIA